MERGASSSVVVVVVAARGCLFGLLLSSSTNNSLQVEVTLFEADMEARKPGKCFLQPACTHPQRSAALGVGWHDVRAVYCGAVATPEHYYPPNIMLDAASTLNIQPIFDLPPSLSFQALLMRNLHCRRPRSETILQVRYTLHFMTSTTHYSYFICMFSHSSSNPCHAIPPQSQSIHPQATTSYAFSKENKKGRIHDFPQTPITLPSQHPAFFHSTNQPW